MYKKYLEEYVNYFKENKNIKNFTVYYSTVSRWVDFLEEKYPDENGFDRANIHDFKEFVEKKCNIKTISSVTNIQAHVNDFMKFVTHKTGYYRRKEVLPLFDDLSKNNLDIEFDIDDFRDIIQNMENLEDGHTSLKYRTVLYLCYYYGMMNKDILSIKWNDFIIENEEYKYLPNKNGFERKVPRNLSKILLELNKYGTSEYVLSLEKENPIKKTFQFIHSLNESYKKYSVYSIRRRLFNYLYDEKDIELDIIMQYMDISVNDLYVYLDNDKVRNKKYDNGIFEKWASSFLSEIEELASKKMNQSFI